MKIAYVVDQFYTDTLKFLLELNKEHECIIYMDIDLYENRRIYTNDYTNIEFKSTVCFIDDLVFNVFDKCYILYYDNFCMPKILLNHKHKIIFVVHNNSHAINVASLGFYWFSFSHMYNKYNHMPPICNSNKKELDIINDQFNKRKNNGDLIKMCTIGNVNVNEIRRVLNMSIISIYIFTLDSSDKEVLQNLQREFPFKVSLIDKKSTDEILEIIEKQNIEFMLYSQLSENYKYEWPGAITFSYNYNIPLVLPNEVANYYNLKGVINSNNNIIGNIQNYYDNINEYTKNFNLYKHQIYNRNKIVDKLVDNRLSCIDTEYGLIFGMENDMYIQNLKSKGYNNKDLVNFISDKISKNKDLIIDVGSYLGVGILGLLSKNMDARIISVEPQLHFAKLQKDMLLYNKYINRVKIYNNAFGHKCQENITMSNELSELDSISNIRAKLDYNDKNVRNFGGLNIGMGGELIDMLSIDALNTSNISSMNNLSIIKIDVEGVEKLVIYGARKTIMEQKPIIMYRKTWKSLTQDIISMLKISNKILSFDIDTFLVNCGYDKKNVIKIDDHIIWQI